LTSIPDKQPHPPVIRCDGQRQSARDDVGLRLKIVTDRAGLCGGWPLAPMTWL
jgi:hypothetical protein